MGLLDIFKKTPSNKDSSQNQVILAMPMFNNGDKYELSAIIENLKTFWDLNVTEVTGDDHSAAFKIDGEMVAITFMPVQIPWDDIKGTAQYAYNWTTAEEDLKEHDGHAFVTLMAGTKSPFQRFQILSKVLCSILTTSNAIGVYQGSQSLLIPKDQYLENIEELKEGGSPISLWVYVGLRPSESGNSVYTYGLTFFDKPEMEIINSKLELEEIFNFISSITSYVIEGNVTFNDGETIGFTEEQKIKITSSKGQFVEGQSLKLEM